MNCPACGTSIQLHPVANGRSGVCSGCGGRLLDRKALQVHLSSAACDRVWAEVDGAQVAEERACPGCDRAMSIWDHGGRASLEIETCLECGLLWCDAGEVERLRRLVQEPVEMASPARWAPGIREILDVLQIIWIH